ncbi:MAG: signal peptidase I [Proteobacteria bacterium]|nr:signal peptidase I [Pseudomonadota bacterium]
MEFMTAWPLTAQQAQFDVSGAGPTVIIVYLVFIVAFYVYYALALQAIAGKTGTPNGWLAWIPIANLVLMCQIGKKPVWWFILLFIPIVNIVFGILIWMAIAEARAKPNWWGIMFIVPVMNLVMPGYLAWYK